MKQKLTLGFSASDCLSLDVWRGGACPTEVGIHVPER